MASGSGLCSLHTPHLSLCLLCPQLPVWAQVDRCSLSGLECGAAAASSQVVASALSPPAGLRSFQLGGHWSGCSFWPRAKAQKGNKVEERFSNKALSHPIRLFFGNEIFRMF